MQAKVSIEHPPAIKPRRSTLLEECVIERGTKGDYMPLSVYHYRAGGIPMHRAVYRARHVPTDAIVAAMVLGTPALQLAARNVLIPGRYVATGGADGRSLAAARLNREVELISRTVIHPTFRGIGLAVRMFKEVLPQRPFRFVEASAVMGAVNPYHERAGMRWVEMPMNPLTSRVLATLRAFGVDEAMVLSPRAMMEWISRLSDHRREQVTQTLCHYAKRWTEFRSARETTKTELRDAAERLAGNATIRPRYYLWENPHVAVA